MDDGFMVKSKLLDALHVGKLHYIQTRSALLAAVLFVLESSCPSLLDLAEFYCNSFNYILGLCARSCDQNFSFPL